MTSPSSPVPTANVPSVHGLALSAICALTRSSPNYAQMTRVVLVDSTDEHYTCDPAGSLAKYTVNIMGKLYECNTTGGLVDVNVKSDAFRGTGRLVCVAYEDVCVSKTTSASRKSATSAGGLQVAYDCSSAWAVDRLRARCLPMDLETRTVSPTTGVARGSGSTRYLLTALIRTIVVTFFFALAFADVLISL
ncbi:hypothetical protein LSAT2_022071 [Lamellibrachia satsuma]|nr:hypothetical protein LSAT2_022071 [Lamellibrachia satsuma]